MQATWQIQEAKNRFSELLGLSFSQGPQTITRHGKPVAQIVAIGAAAPKQAALQGQGADGGFTRHLLSAPRLTTEDQAQLTPPARRNRKQAPRLGE